MGINSRMIDLVNRPLISSFELERYGGLVWQSFDTFLEFDRSWVELEGWRVLS